MSITATYCEKVIENKTYGTTDEMKEKLDVFLLNNRLTQAEYNQLISSINPNTTDTSTSTSSGTSTNTSTTDETTTS